MRSIRAQLQKIWRVVSLIWRVWRLLRGSGFTPIEITLGIFFNVSIVVVVTVGLSVAVTNQIEGGRQGPPGSSGVPGATGGPGPTGVPGATGAPVSTKYEIFTESMQIAPDVPGTLEVRCPPGANVTGGGGRVTGVNPELSSSRPTANRDGWSVSASIDSGGIFEQLEVWVVCATSQ